MEGHTKQVHNDTSPASNQYSGEVKDASSIQRSNQDYNNNTSPNSMDSASYDPITSHDGSVTQDKLGVKPPRDKSLDTQLLTSLQPPPLNSPYSDSTFSRELHENRDLGYNTDMYTTPMLPKWPGFQSLSDRSEYLVGEVRSLYMQLVMMNNKRTVYLDHLVDRLRMVDYYASYYKQPLVVGGESDRKWEQTTQSPPEIIEMTRL